MIIVWLVNRDLAAPKTENIEGEEQISGPAIGSPGHASQQEGVVARQRPVLSRHRPRALSIPSMNRPQTRTASVEIGPHKTRVGWTRESGQS